MVSLKRVLLLFAFSASVSLVSCGEEKCRLEEADTLSGSISYTLGGSYEMTIDGEKQEDEHPLAYITFWPLTADTANGMVALRNAEGVYFEVHIDNPVKLSGKPYDVEFEYKGKAKSVWIEKTEYEEVDVQMKGWMKRDLPETRCSPYLGFRCDINYQFSVGDNTYIINVSPHLSWN